MSNAICYVNDQSTVLIIVPAKDKKPPKPKVSQKEKWYKDVLAYAEKNGITPSDTSPICKK